MDNAVAIPVELLDGLKAQLNAAKARLEQHSKDEELVARIERMISIGSGEESIAVTGNKRGARSQESIEKGKATVARKKAAAAVAVLPASKPA